MTTPLSTLLEKLATLPVPAVHVNQRVRGHYHELNCALHQMAPRDAKTLPKSPFPGDAIGSRAAFKSVERATLVLWRDGINRWWLERSPKDRTRIGAAPVSDL